MASFLNASLMSNVSSVLSMGADAVKFARQAVKGMGQDARFFRDSKKGALSSFFGVNLIPRRPYAPCVRAPPRSDTTALPVPYCAQVRSASSASSCSPPTSTS
jgi:hypothetical protein